MEGCQGGLFGWFDHHRVSTAQGWCDLPHEHQQRKVPLAQTKEHICFNCCILNSRIKIIRTLQSARGLRRLWTTFTNTGFSCEFPGSFTISSGHSGMCGDLHTYSIYEGPPDHPRSSGALCFLEDSIQSNFICTVSITIYTLSIN